MGDAINPDHYKLGPRHSVCGEPIECIDTIINDDFLIGNAKKYLWRLGKKDDSVQEIRKAIWYLNKKVEQLEGKL